MSETTTSTRLRSTSHATALGAVCLLLGASAAFGASGSSWRQFGGPSSEFRAAGEDLTGTPEQLWRQPLGPGYSAIVVDGDELYTMTRIPAPDGSDNVVDRDRVVALDATTGALRWQHEYDAPAREENLLQFGSGPHATPLVLDDRIVTLGYTGHLRALRRSDGQLLWSHRLLEDLGGDVLPWGYSASPILHDGLVIVLVGGPQAVLALDPETGERRWASAAGTVSYSTPRVLEVGSGADSQLQLLYFGKDHLASLDPRDGRERWRIELKNGYQNHASNLLFNGELLWVASQQEAAARALRLVENGSVLDQPTEVWANTKIRLHHWNAVLDDRGVVFGTFGDQGQRLGAVSLATGEFLWQRRSPAMGKPLLTATGPLFLFEDGTLQQFDGDGKPVGDGVVVAGNDVWTVPTLVDQVLYVRDRANISAFRMGPKGATPASGGAAP